MKEEYERISEFIHSSPLLLDKKNAGKQRLKAYNFIEGNGYFKYQTV